MRYLVVLVILLSACSKISRPVQFMERKQNDMLGYGQPMALSELNWQHETKTNDEFRRDAYECERDRASVRSRQQASELQDRCMLSKGWRRR